MTELATWDRRTAARPAHWLVPDVPSLDESAWEAPGPRRRAGGETGVRDDARRRRLSDTALQIRERLAVSKADWTRLSTLALELGLPEFYVAAALERLGDDVRRPVGAQEDEQDCFRLSARGLTFGERLRILKARVGRYPLV